MHEATEHQRVDNWSLPKARALRNCIDPMPPRGVVSHLTQVQASFFQTYLGDSTLAACIHALMRLLVVFSVRRISRLRFLM